jgi:hypothetical protein
MELPFTRSTKPAPPSKPRVWHVLHSDPSRTLCRQLVDEEWEVRVADWATPRDAIEATGAGTCLKCTDAPLKSSPIKDLRNNADLWIDRVDFKRVPRRNA